jgi:hypothetical protein
VNLNEIEKIFRVYADYPLGAIAIGVAVWIGDRVSLLLVEFGDFEVIGVAKFYLDEYGVLVGLFWLTRIQPSAGIVVLVLRRLSEIENHFTLIATNSERGRRQFADSPDHQGTPRNTSIHHPHFGASVVPLRDLCDCVRLAYVHIGFHIGGLVQIFRVDESDELSLPHTGFFFRNYLYSSPEEAHTEIDHLEYTLPHTVRHIHCGRHRRD